MVSHSQNLSVAQCAFDESYESRNVPCHAGSACPCCFLTSNPGGICPGSLQEPLLFRQPCVETSPFMGFRPLPVPKQAYCHKHHNIPCPKNGKKTNTHQMIGRITTCLCCLGKRKTHQMVSRTATICLVQKKKRKRIAIIGVLNGK